MFEHRCLMCGGNFVSDDEHEEFCCDECAEDFENWDEEE